MRRVIVLFIVVLFSNSVSAQDFDQNKMRYIERFKYWAMDEQIRTGVPASISLAQGIHETGSGTSDLAKLANNHFGIKCKKEWTGETFLHDDDRRHECFRKYKSAKQSYIDHSNFLKTRAWYASLFQLEVTDYDGWCKGLKKAGYATNPKYAIRLVELIEKYNLQQYTYEAIEIAKENNLVAEVVPKKDKEVEKIEVAKEIVKAVKAVKAPRKIKHRFGKLTQKNGRPGFWARQGDYLLPEAVAHNIRYAKMLSINDLDDEPLYTDLFIYLKKKARRGDRQYHRVKSGETLHEISQNVGVQLNSLYAFNNLDDGQEPAIGEKIYLQGHTTKVPKLAAAQIDKQPIEVEVEKKKVVKQEAIIVKKTAEVEKIDFPKEVKKADKIVGAEKKIAEKKKDVIVEKKVIEKKVVVTPIKKEVVPVKKVVEKVVVKKKADPRIIKKVATKEVATRTKMVGKKVESPVLDFEKAKKTEMLFGDGSKEIAKLHYKAQQAAKTNRVIAEPGGRNTKEVIIEKATKTAVKKSKRKYEDENVSDDVKDLKKKFDNLIYGDD